MSDVTLILQRIDRGDADAAAELLPLVYEELRRIAASRMAHEAPGNTLQATALVHEAWLRLGGDAQPGWNNRTHFIRAAAEAMRHILIDHARRRRALRHGGGLERLNVDDCPVPDGAPAQDDHLLEVHESLERLAALEPRKAELVKLRYFIGLTLEEAALALEVSLPTAKRDWAYARAWLFEDIERFRRS